MEKFQRNSLHQSLMHSLILKNSLFSTNSQTKGNESDSRMSKIVFFILSNLLLIYSSQLTKWKVKVLPFSKTIIFKSRVKISIILKFKELLSPWQLLRNSGNNSFKIFINSRTKILQMNKRRLWHVLGDNCKLCLTL